MRIIKCLSRIAVMGSKLNITIGTFEGYFIGWELFPQEHRVPNFMTLHSHIIIEELLEDLWIFHKKFYNKSLLLLYDITHGIICSYNMREILQFWMRRGKK